MKDSSLQPTAKAFLLVAVVVLAGCGSARHEGPGPSPRPGGSSPQWCRALHAISDDPSTDQTGKANTYEHVKLIKQRYTEQLRQCPGVTGFGSTTVPVFRAMQQRKSRPLPGPGPAAKDWAILVTLLKQTDLPPKPLFLDGVPLLFHVSGPIRALSR